MHVIALLQLLLLPSEKKIGRAGVCPSALEGWWPSESGATATAQFVRIEAAESIEGDTYPPSASIEIKMGGSGECACSWFCYSGVYC